MKLSEYIDNNRDDFDWDDEGRLKVTIDSSMLSGVTVDTYSTFTGDSFTDQTIEYFSENLVVDYPINSEMDFAPNVTSDDIDFKFDFEKILKELAETAAEGFAEHCAFVENFDILSTFSPRAYNFSTDSFNATWTIDIDMLSREMSDAGIVDDIDIAQQWALTEYESCSGFISYIPDYFEDNRGWALVWAYLDRYLRFTGYDGVLHVSDEEYTAYDAGCTVTPLPSLYAKHYQALTGVDAPESVTDEESLLAALPPVQDERLF